MNKREVFNSITPAQAYTTIAPPSAGGGVAGTIEAQLPVNFSGQSQSGTPSAFTVGGWVRIVDLPAGESTNPLFLVGGQFGLAVNSAGLLVAFFGSIGSTEVVTSKLGIVDTEWHYVTVTCGQNNDIQGASVIFVLDGISVGEKTIVSNANPNQGPCTIGNGKMEFVSWTIWSVTLPPDQLIFPEFGPPKSDSVMAHDMVAAFNFASGKALDVSGNNVPITTHSGPSYLPRLALNVGSQLTPAAADNITFFGPESGFMAWVQLQPVSKNNTYYNIVTLVGTGNSGGGGSTSFLQVVKDTSGDPAKCTVGLQGVFGGPGWTNVPTESYVHIAVSMVKENGGMGTVAWLNGQQSGAGQGGVNDFTPKAVNFAMLDPYPGADFVSAIQGISVWNRGITDIEVNADIAGVDPTGSEGLVAYYALQHDLRNSVTGNKASLTNASLVDIVEKEGMSHALAEALSAAPRSVIDESNTIKFLQPADYLALAQAHGIDIHTSGDKGALSEGHQKMLAWFDENIDTSGALEGYSREDILRNLRIGEELRSAGVKTGQMDVVVEGNQTVVYFHGEDGPQEIYRISEVLDPFIQWLLTIIVDAIALLGSIFGLLTTSAKLRDIVQVIVGTLPTIKNALIDALDHGKVSGAQAVIAVVEEIYSAGLLLTVIKGLVTGSWWSLVFTALSVLGQLLTLVFSGGAVLVIKLALFAVALAKLVYDLTQYPPPSALEGEGTTPVDGVLK